QLLTESLVLSAIGGALGLALAWLLVDLAPLLAARDFPRLDDVAIDRTMVAFTAAASLFAAISSGVAPALRGARVHPGGSLRRGLDAASSRHAAGGLPCGVDAPGRRAGAGQGGAVRGDAGIRRGDRPAAQGRPPVSRQRPRQPGASVGGQRGVRETVPAAAADRVRSEERRVGKECRCRGWPYEEKEKRRRAVGKD